MYHFIVNPGARTGKGKMLWDRLESIIKERKTEYAVYFTEYAGHATEIAKKICSEHPENKRIVIVGGDGTANEAVNGLSGYDSIVLGYIPTGSSNDLARGYGISSDPEKALEAVLAPKKFRKVDHGLVEFLGDGGSRKFSVSCGIGYDADICYKALTSKLKKALNKVGLGKTIYYLIGLREIFSKHPASAEIELDGAVEVKCGKLIFAASMNLPIEGGGMPMAPEADPGDGKLDVCVARDISKLTHITAMPLIFGGKHTRKKGIDVVRGSVVEIRTSEPLAVHTDGEHAGFHDHIRLSCLPEKITMIVG
ncbi:MAG: diacylglycerol kinase family lipid kinase [Lachnospiraceae bacterium]|nr:diacylglycerol kinase family lipid kinase [Lachnospiraceae bacterium]